MKYAEDGYVLQVGDFIQSDNWIGKSRYKVVRVTKTMAFVRYNERVEGKFPRVYGFWFGPKPRESRGMTTYRVIPANAQETAD